MKINLDEILDESIKLLISKFKSIITGDILDVFIEDRRKTKTSVIHNVYFSFMSGTDGKEIYHTLEIYNKPDDIRLGNEELGILFKVKFESGEYTLRDNLSDIHKEWLIKAMTRIVREVNTVMKRHIKVLKAKRNEIDKLIKEFEQ